MTSRRTPSPPPGSDEWWNLRRSGIGATDAANVLGRGRYGTPWTKYQEMRGLTVPKVSSEAMAWGILLQPVVGRAWSESTGIKVRACNMTYWHPTMDRVFSHYDFDTPGGILEVKTTGWVRDEEWGEQDSDQVPEEYLIQAQHELMCRPGKSICYIAVLIGGQKFRRYEVRRDDELIGMMETVYTDFLGRVDRDDPPVIDGSYAATEYLRARYPSDNGEEIVLDDKGSDLARQYLAAKAVLDDAERSAYALRNAICDLMGPNAVARSDDGLSITYRKEKDHAVVDWPAVGAEVPEVVARHTTVVEGRRPLLVRYKGA